MGFHKMLVQVTWVWVGVILSEMAAAAAIPFPLALPGCSDRCGDLEIPYPFGTTEGCYLKESTPLKTKWNQSLWAGSFTVSNTQNKFVAVGCDTYAYLKGSKDGEPFSIGCLSVCQNISSVPNGTCSGIGCCQLDIPQGLKNVYVSAYSFNNHTNVSDFNPCSFAFIIQEDKFKFLLRLSFQSNKQCNSSNGS
uniref:Wall-associated receptor kinase galacturonan-binding domain-containing protein n=1 Tax=Fagus sylvatica TaxID=28930 RepID=A0A2N9IR05_FAGSY